MTQTDARTTFNQLQKELGFSWEAIDEAEGWCTTEAWVSCLQEMQTLSGGEITFDFTESEEEIDLVINQSIPLRISHPDDTFEASVIDQINEHIATLGLFNRFYLLTPDHVEVAADPLVAIGYMDAATYAILAAKGFGDEREYAWENYKATWTGL